MNPVDDSQFLLHLVFSTKDQRLLISPDIEPILYDKISKILYDECYSPALIVGGAAEHVHIIYAQSRIWSIDGLVEHLKKQSGEFMKKWVEDFDWQKGYGAFTISRSQKELEKKYIYEQKEFHKTVSYKNEFRGILRKQNIEFDEEGLWE